jgi:rhodanese-related sulfurtransferase
LRRCIDFHVRAAVDPDVGNNLETLGMALYRRSIRGGLCEVRGAEGGSLCDLGGIMSQNMFSGIGAGSNPDIVDFGDLEEAVGTNAWIIVDVREPHEFAAGHVPNALNMPMSSFDPKALPEGKPVVLVCQSGGRSRNALGRARAIGREDVRHFAEGMNGWRSHNGPVTL